MAGFGFGHFASCCLHALCWSMTVVSDNQLMNMMSSLGKVLSPSFASLGVLPSGVGTEGSAGGLKPKPCHSGFIMFLSRRSNTYCPVFSADTGAMPVTSHSFYTCEIWTVPCVLSYPGLLSEWTLKGIKYVTAIRHFNNKQSSKCIKSCITTSKT